MKKVIATPNTGAVTPACASALPEAPDQSPMPIPKTTNIAATAACGLKR